MRPGPMAMSCGTDRTTWPRAQAADVPEEHSSMPQVASRQTNGRYVIGPGQEDDAPAPFAVLGLLILGGMHQWIPLT